MINYHHRIVLYIPMCLILSYWGYMKVPLPIIPDLLLAFKTTEPLLQQLISIAFILSGLSSILWGVLIDRYDIKRFLVALTCIAIVTLSSISTSTNVWFWGLSYILGATLVGGLMVCSRSFIMIYLTNEADIKKALSMPMAAGYFAAFFTPYISGWLAHFLDWNYAFLIIPFWLVILLSLLIKLPPPPQELNKKSHIFNNIKAMINHLSNKTFLYSVLGIAFISSITQSYYVAIIFWLISDYSISIESVALYLFPLLFPGMLLPLFVSRINQKFNEKRMINIYITIFFLASITAFVLNANFNSLDPFNSWFWVIPGVLCTVAQVCLIPILFFKALHTVKSHVNSASGLIAIALYSAGGIGIYITSFIHLESFYLEGLFILFATLSLTLCLFKSRQIEEKSQHTP